MEPRLRRRVRATTDDGLQRRRPRGDPYPFDHELPDGRRARTRSAARARSRATARSAARRGSSVTQRVKALGSHEIKAGVDVEDNIARTTARLYSGGAFIQNYVGRQVVTSRAGSSSRRLDASTDPRFDQTLPHAGSDRGGATGSTLTFACDYLGGTLGAPGTQVARQHVQLGRRTCATRGRSGRT